MRKIYGIRRVDMDAGPKTALILLLVLAGMLVGGELRAASGRERLVISGNELIATEDILRAVWLPEGEESDETITELLRRNIANYYKARGYSLARVWTKIHENRIYITIDEGKLEKVIILGRGTMMTLMMKLIVHFPGNVFNEQRMKEEIAKIRRRLGIRNVTYRVVESPKVLHIETPLDKLDIPFFDRKPALHELHIIVQKGRGVGPNIGGYTHPSYGFVPFFSYTEKQAFFKEKEDRLYLQMATGYNVRKRIEPPRNWKLLFTHAQGMGRYDFPALWGFLRFYTELSAEASNFQRPDLPLEEYWHFLLHGSLNMGFDVRRGLEIHAGGGLERKSVFSVKPVPGGGFSLDPFESLRGFVGMGFSWNFNPRELRLDRHNLLQADYRTYLHDVVSYHRVYSRYDHLFPIGYHDIYLRTAMLLTFGKTPFYEEQPLGGLLMRTFFQGRYYIDKGGWLSAEFRVSLLKDIVKFSIFNDIAVFGDLERTNASAVSGRGKKEKPALADAFGPGLHILILDTFQFDIYYSLGFVSPYDYGSNIYFTLFKAFE